MRTIGAHGYNAYTYGCRCQTCRAAKAAYMRARRRAARELAQANTFVGGPHITRTGFAEGARHYVQGVTHGTSYAYHERGCRCLHCTVWKSDTDHDRVMRREGS